MRKEIVKNLVCPNSGESGIEVFGLEVFRDEKLHKSLNDDELFDTDDVKTGLLIVKKSMRAYVISEYVAILLSDEDADTNHSHPLLEEIGKTAPTNILTIINETIKAQRKLKKTKDGLWNYEEMKYYDEDVDSSKKQKKMLNSILHDDLWRIFSVRKKYLISYLETECVDKLVLEIGCGNSRTVNRKFNPLRYGYQYIGTDISFLRLTVAKKAMPSQDFIQASALNLPFKSFCFQAIISFGMLHHLRLPYDAIEHCSALLKANGMFVLHEPIKRKDSFFSNSRLMLKWFQTYEHSERDDKIDFAATNIKFRDLGFTLCSNKFEISVFRAFFDALAKKFTPSFVKSKFYNTFIRTLDEIPLRTVCKVFNQFGPNATLSVFRKTIKS